MIYSARTPADVDVNMAEWRYNNDFGKNEFLYEPAHTDYTIYARNGEVFKHVRNARSIERRNANGSDASGRRLQGRGRSGQL